MSAAARAFGAQPRQCPQMFNRRGKSTAAIYRPRIKANANSATSLAGGTVHQAQKVFDILSIVFPGDGIAAVGCLYQGAIMVVFPLPLALVIRRGLLAGLRRSYVASDIRARTTATIGVTLGYNFGARLCTARSSSEPCHRRLNSGLSAYRISRAL
jgi:hypothetical protein